jgi:hypothetical protein
MEPFYSAEGFSGAYTLLTFATFMPLATLVSSALVATFVWKPYFDKCQAEPSETYVTPIEFRYPIEEAIEGKVPDENSYVMETIDPYGQIAISWNDEDKVFEYWGRENVPFVVLESVARKFVTMNCCSQIYKEMEEDEVEYEDETETNTNKIPDTDEKAENVASTEGEAEISVFATFKSYNKINKSRASRDIIRNHYRHKGEIQKIFSRAIQGSEPVSTSCLDFSTYKKMFLGKQIGKQTFPNL